MNRITYFADGQNTEFAFSFAFFQTADIVVELNGIVQTSGYTVSSVNNTEPADIPYVGGNVIFTTPPTNGAVIAIYRKILPERNVDYQPTEKIDPELLNQDFNHLLEIIKDCYDAIDCFDTKYAELTNLPEIKQLLQKLNLLGDISTIARNDDITALQNATSFSTSGRAQIANWATPTGDAIDLNLIGTTAGTYSYIAEKSGIVSLVFTPRVNGEFSILAPSGRTMWNETMTANQRRTVLFPVNRGKSIAVTVPELSYISFQRLFPYQGAM